MNLNQFSLIMRSRCYIQFICNDIVTLTLARLNQPRPFPDSFRFVLFRVSCLVSYFVLYFMSRFVSYFVSGFVSYFVSGFDSFRFVSFCFVFRLAFRFASYFVFRESRHFFDCQLFLLFILIASFYRVDSQIYIETLYIVQCRRCVIVRWLLLSIFVAACRLHSENFIRIDQSLTKLNLKINQASSRYLDLSYRANHERL